MKKVCQKCKEVCQKCKPALKKLLKVLKENILITLVVIAVVIIVAGLGVYSAYAKSGVKIITAQAAGQKAVDYINVNLLKVDAKDGVSLKSIQKDGDIYKGIISYNGQDSDIYISKDGKYLFPAMQGVPIKLNEKLSTAASGNENQVKSCETMPKADKPVLQAFIVSNCPFGIQMQRILAKAIEQGVSAGDVEVKYIGSISSGKIISMHKDEEAQENLKQICIREEQASKYWDYVSCYIKAGNTSSCLTSAGVDKNKLNSCVTDSNKGLKYAQADFDIANQYGATGSPTLILGGSSIDEFSFGGRTADAAKSIICCGYNNQPAFCSTTMSKDEAAASFSETYTSASGSANSNASCAQ